MPLQRILTRNPGRGWVIPSLGEQGEVEKDLTLMNAWGRGIDGQRLQRRLGAGDDRFFGRFERDLGEPALPEPRLQTVCHRLNARTSLIILPAPNLKARE